MHRAIELLDDSALPMKFVETVSSFMPINQPLYGLVLFALMPSLYARSVFVRPAKDTNDIVNAIYKVLNLEYYWPNVYIKNVTRRSFLEQSVPVSDVVVFVGRYQNAEIVRKYIKKDALFLFTGSGANPFVICKDADLQLATEKAIAAKLYNSGQDCAAPNVFLVDIMVLDNFIALLKLRLEGVGVGEYSNHFNKVGPLVRKESVEQAKKLLETYKKKIIFGGNCELEKRIISPTLLLCNFDDCIIYEETYAPVFVVCPFYSQEELQKYFFNSKYVPHSMYVSVFGESINRRCLNKSIILENSSVLDYEAGHKKFGGYGFEANQIRVGDEIRVEPFLIPEEIVKYKKFTNICNMGI
jgi:acyl-CoA reductase-like NAD-dependent aldehyde dehydrogenase